MKRYLWTILVASALAGSACITPGPTPAPQPPTAPPVARATLAVVVTDAQTHAPVAGAAVTLHTGEAAATNADGYAAFDGLVLGARGVEVKADGYRDGFLSVEAFAANLQVAVVLEQVAPPAPVVTMVARPLVGPLRVQDKLFRDDTGYRRVFFCSWFTALRTLRDNPAEFDRELDAIVGAGYQGFRVFLAVGGWSDYWDGHEVQPLGFQKWLFTPETGHLRPASLGATVQAWPDYDDLFRALLRKVRARGLRLDVTVGDMQIIVGNDQATELALHRRLSAIAAAEGGTDVIDLVEGTNEVPLNRYGGDGPASIEQLGRVLAIWRQALPGVLTTQGAFLSEEPARLYASITHGQVAAVHVTRDPIELAIKRTAGLVFWEGNYRAFPVPYWHTEPAGPGRDSYAAQNNPANLTALYAMQALTGAASNYFNGPSVRGDGPLESTWGFRELPALFAAQLPEDIATWSREVNAPAHGVMYWTRGQEFRTAIYETWNPAPPRPIAEWTLYAGDQVTHGTGTPPSKITGLLVGRFQ